jgi:hypothetical protein
MAVRSVVSKNLYILIVKKQSSIILAKGCFTVGEEQAFLPFIKSKCAL